MNLSSDQQPHLHFLISIPLTIKQYFCSYMYERICMYVYFQNAQKLKFYGTNITLNK